MALEGVIYGNADGWLMFQFAIYLIQYFKNVITLMVFTLKV